MTVKRIIGLAAVACAMAPLGATAATRAGYDVAEKSIPQLKADLAAGRVTSAELVRLYEARIVKLDPKLHAVIAVNPLALKQAAASDAARRKGSPLGPLAGVPILLKDNIETADPMATTAGSLALKDNVSGRDAPLAARLRAAGGIILGKTNLSEWANYRSSRSVSGWSGRRGQVRNPYALDRSPCGSSAGSGSAAAASLAAAAIGTETDGSVTCPSAVNGLVGLKPTVGLISRTHVVPISHTQDTPGPMTRSVTDAAILLGVLAGSDPEDAATAHADAVSHDYVSGLKADALKAQGAVLVDIKAFPNTVAIRGYERTILQTDLKADLGAYLASTDPKKVRSRTLADLIAFNHAHAADEMPLFGQELFESSQETKGVTDTEYVKAVADAHRYAGPEGIDAMLKSADVVALLAPTLGPAGMIDPILRDRSIGGGAGGPAAISGYPHLTVPMGNVSGLPVGLSFIGTAWSEGRLLALGYAYEQATKARTPPTYAATIKPPGA
ncbi:amidase [soil metagenome]